MAGVKPERSGKFALALKNAIALSAAGRVLAYMPLDQFFLRRMKLLGGAIVSLVHILS